MTRVTRSFWNAFSKEQVYNLAEACDFPVRFPSLHVLAFAAAARTAHLCALAGVAMAAAQEALVATHAVWTVAAAIRIVMGVTALARCRSGIVGGRTRRLWW